MKAIKSYNQLSQEFMRYKEKETNQQEIEFTIIEIKESFIYNYSKLTLLFNNEINDQFIIKPVYNINKASKIKIKFNDIIFRNFNGILYLEIKYISAITKDNPNIINKKYNNFKFSLHKYFNCLSELKQINYNSLVSIPVKIKEKEAFDGIPNIIFKDINKEPLIIQFDNEKLNVEGQKIYMLEGFLYNHKENKLYQLPNSNATEIIELLDTNKTFEKSEIPNLYNFKGKITSFDFIRRVININVEYEGKNSKYEIEVNSGLFSKISLNCDCFFYDFYKTAENKYKSNYFSNIKYQQKTYITINFADDIKDKYYDSMKCDKITKEINKKSITFELDDYSNKTSEIKTITYLKKDTNKNIIDQEDFHFEINTGKNNNVDSLSTKTDGYSYQLYFETNNKNILPETYTIKDANKRDIIIKPEKNENEFYERFTILNVPFQNIKENYENKNLSNFSLNDKKGQEIKEKSFKYLFINNNNKIKMHKFILKKQENCKIFYDQFKKYEDDLKIFFLTYFKKQMDLLKRDIININESETNKNILNIFSNKTLQDDLKKIIEKGFDEYYFDNCQRDYALIRNICFAFLCLKAKENDFNLMKYNQIFSTFKSILSSLSMEYIDRIKAVIAITREFNYRYLYSNISGLYVVKLKTKDTKYSYYTNAMKKFLNIINGLTETCAFYKAIRQFNSIILNDELTNKNIYSGTILNIKDIQIELFKQSGQFCIIQEGIPNLYGSYWSCARTIFLNPDTIFGKYYDKVCLAYIKKDKNSCANIIKRATSSTLFVIFHEITGHLKTHINSLNDSPGQVHLNDKEVQMPKPDSGYFFEYIMADNIISCRHFVDSSISEQLLDEKLYLSDNFNELKEKLSQIKYALSPMNVTITKDNEKKVKFLNEKIDDINENYNKMTIDELYVFFSNLDEEQMKKIQDSEAYKFFLSFYNEKGKKI